MLSYLLLLFDDMIDGAGPQKSMKQTFIYVCVEKTNLQCGVWDEVVEQKGTCPLLSVELEALNQPKNILFVVFNFICLFLHFLLYSKSKYDKYIPLWATSLHFGACS